MFVCVCVLASAVVGYQTEDIGQVFFAVEGLPDYTNFMCVFVCVYVCVYTTAGVGCQTVEIMSAACGIVAMTVQMCVHVQRT